MMRADTLRDYLTCRHVNDKREPDIYLFLNKKTDQEEMYRMLGELVDGLKRTLKPGDLISEGRKLYEGIYYQFVTLS
jgi:hypothetical protein